MKNIVYEIFGWIGTILILGAYLLVSFGMLSGESVSFQVMNIIGSFGLLAIGYVKKVYQSVVLNSIWALIGIVALVKLFL